MADSTSSTPNDTRPAAHTSGPWTEHPFDESQRVIYGPEYDGGKREMIAIVSVGTHRPHGEANARLMTAAPLMLEALKFAVANGLHPLNCTGPLHAICSCWIGQSRAAIAAAQAPSETAS